MVSVEHGAPAEGPDSWALRPGLAAAAGDNASSSQPRPGGEPQAPLGLSQEQAGRRVACQDSVTGAWEVAGGSSPELGLALPGSAPLTGPGAYWRSVPPASWILPPSLSSACDCRPGHLL